MPRRFSVVLACVLGAGCSALVGSDNVQCKTQSDCDNRFGSEQNLTCVENLCVARTCTVSADCAEWGSQFAEHQCIDGMCQLDAKWQCLSQSQAPAQVSGSFLVKLHLRDIVSQMSLAGVSAQLCRKLDVNCDAPERAYLSDENGDLYIDVPAPFTGYLSLTRDDLMPTLYFFNPPITYDQELPAVSLASPGIARTLTGQAGAMQRPERGLVLLAALDCVGGMTSGISYTSDGDGATVPFYSVRSLPSTSVTSTDTSGFGGFINAPPGTLAITAVREADQRAIGTTSVLIKAGAMTSTRISPLAP